MAKPNTLKKNIALQASKGTISSTGTILHVTAENGNTIYYVASDTELSEGSAVAGCFRLCEHN
ncbi:MAG TPA: hypothetical protein VJ888_08810 [Mobilitalea sp.]|nr:hypothetical protein [Mobilitalea sp.]